MVRIYSRMNCAREKRLYWCALLKLAVLFVMQAAVHGICHGQLAASIGSPTPSTTTDGSSLENGSAAQEAQVSGSNAPSYQSTGYISGTVLDQSGAISVGANVRLTRDGQDSAQQVQSGSNGEFFFSKVAPGPFRLSVSASGFATHEVSAALQPGATLLLPPIILTVEATIAEVHVKQSALSQVQLADIQVNEQMQQRVLGFIPNFYVTYDRNTVSLSARQKFRLAWKSTSDPFTFVGVAFLAGTEQATDSPKGYGQGAQGYFKRVGASYADVVTSTYIGGAVLPSVLRQDPRYFYKGSGNVGSRLLYAVSSPFFCKGDNMRWQPNYSNVGGAFASAGISYLYYPESDRNGAGLVFRNSAIRLGEMAFEGVLQEFVIRRLTPRLKKRASDQR